MDKEFFWFNMETRQEKLFLPSPMPMSEQLVDLRCFGRASM